MKRQVPSRSSIGLRNKVPKVICQGREDSREGLTEFQVPNFTWLLGLCRPCRRVFPPKSAWLTAVWERAKMASQFCQTLYVASYMKIGNHPPQLVTSQEAWQPPHTNTSLLKLCNALLNFDETLPAKNSKSSRSSRAPEVDPLRHPQPKPCIPSRRVPNQAARHPARAHGVARWKSAWLGGFRAKYRTLRAAGSRRKAVHGFTTLGSRPKLLRGLCVQIDLLAKGPKIPRHPSPGAPSDLQKTPSQKQIGPWHDLAPRTRSWDVPKPEAGTVQLYCS